MRALLAFLVLLGGPAAMGDGARKLVVLWIDGLDYRYLRDADKLHLKIPVLRKLMAGGAVADGVVGVVPGDTLSGSATIATGVSPWQHGGGAQPTFWQAALKASRRVGLLYWPGSSDAAASFLCPAPGAAGGGEIPFESVAGKCTPGLVERVTAAYPRFQKALWNDESALDALIYLLDAEKPDITLVHLADLDAEQHETGALSLYSRDVLENDDELLGQLLKKLPTHSVLAVVSSHGFETEDRVVRPRVLTNSKHVEVRHGLIGTSDDAEAASLRKLAGSRKSGISREVPLAEVKRFAPELTAWRAAFDTFPGFVATEETKGAAVGAGNHKGVHELWPTRPNFRSAFIVWGEGVQPVHLGEISLLQIAPTLASIAGVPLPEAEQASLWPKMTALRAKRVKNGR